MSVYGISRDSPWTHIAWSQVLDLNGLGFTYRGLEGVSQRSVFLVDTGGTVRGAWAYETGEVPDVDELLAAARRLPASS